MALLLRVLCLVPAVRAYLPVFMMHGIGSGSGEMDTIRELAEAAHPGTAAAVAGAVRAAVAANATLYADGYHVVCKSQGGLICRAALMLMDDHAARTFVSLAGPQAGVFGPDFFKDVVHDAPLLENVTAEEAYHVAYTWAGQKLSVANMWRDPNHLDDCGLFDHCFDEGNVFLPNFLDKATAAMKANFLRLEKVVLCVGSGPAYDGGIEPWQSAVFGAADASGAIAPMEDQDFYATDAFGLRTLASRAG
ncbi:palmitoyl-(protein) hydrolase [Aureococcus anophagefferens]|nr:palmitoyl-(protein) hydrolase [Aureococcus anophagefferens]